MTRRVDLCPTCHVGKMVQAGPPFTDATTLSEELNVVFACEECGYSEIRYPEPPDESQRDHGEVH